jgi:hypothetical protein
MATPSPHFDRLHVMHAPTLHRYTEQIYASVSLTLCEVRDPLTFVMVMLSAGGLMRAILYKKPPSYLSSSS